MLDVVLQILSVLGIILLVLLGLLLAVMLFTLFFPVIYRVSGEGNGKDFSLDAKASWLFGLLRVRFAYPDPGKFKVKALWFTVFDSEEASSETKTGENEKSKGQGGSRQQENPE